MTTKSLVPYQGNQIIASFDDAERAAKAMSASGFFQDARQAAQALVKILAGQELGFGPFASMTGVSIIQGKPAVGANLQAAAVKKTGKYNYRVIEMTNDACELEFYEDGKPVGKSRFDMKDAAAAGLSNKDNWKKWPRNMLFARAISNGVKWYAPDIFNGATVYTPDELGAVENEDGEVIDVRVVETPAEEKASDKKLAGDRFVELCRNLFASLADERSAAVLESYKGDVDKALAWAEKRANSFATEKGLVDHVKANWPNFEGFVSPVVSGHNPYDPFAIINGIDLLFQLQRDDPEAFASMDDDQIVAYILDYQK